jgi:hypothetical protein
MNLPLSVAVVLSQFIVPVVDRGEVAREQRLTSISIAIGRASGRATCTGDYAVEGCKRIIRDATEAAAILSEWADAESALLKNVQAGQCKPNECDPVRMWDGHKVAVQHRARGLWQLHRLGEWSNETWNLLHGLTQQSLDAQAWEAIKRFQLGRGQCGSIEGAFANVATGNSCTWKGAHKRAVKTDLIRVRLVKLQATEPEGC